MENNEPNINQPQIINQIQNVQTNNGCFTGCGQYIIGFFVLGLIIAIIDAFAPLIGVIIGLVVGSWVGYFIGPATAEENFKQVLLQLRKTNWRDFKNVEISIKMKLYYLLGCAIPLAIIGFVIGRNISDSY